MSDTGVPREAAAVRARRETSLVRLLGALDGAHDAAADFDAAAALVLEAVCRYLRWPLGHAYAFDPARRSLEPTAVWYERHPGRHRSFIEATETTTLRAGEGFPGRALALGRPVLVDDLARDVPLARSEAARAAGLRMGLAVPAYAGGNRGTVLEFFTEDARAPGATVLSVLEHVGREWSRVLERQELAVALGRSEERFRAIVESAADAIILADEEGKVLSWNRAATRMFGYERDEVRGRSLTLIMPERYRARHIKAFAEAVRRPTEVLPGNAHELEGLTKDGREFPVELTLASWTDQRRYFAGILRDVSARTAAENELRLLASAASHVRDAIVVSTAGDSGRGPTILYVNTAFTRITGYPESEVLGRSFDILAGAKTDPDALPSVHRRLRGGEAAAAEVVAYRKDGSDFLLEWQASPIYESDGTVVHVASILRDVTEERRVQHALRRADRDPLTGLPSREILRKRLKRSLERNEEREEYRFALLFIDLDGFKAVNDEHGHVAGDQLLTSAAGRLERTVRPGDTLTRFGGDEFVILLEYVAGIADVIMVAERVRERLSEPFVIQGRELGIAASVGVALSETGYADVDDVIRDADRAMYEAKRRGKGRVQFADRSLYGEVVSVIRLHEDMRLCLEREELELHYQPLVDLATGVITGFEALVRWRHAELGLLLPHRFIPLAEQSGFVVPMGRWILRAACTEAHDWRHTTPSGAPLTLSVNMSVRELASPDLVDAIRTTLEETGLDPSRLELELTESVFIETLEPVRSRIAALRALGVSVCIDDFGTGYSSLGHLHRLPVDKIKIDRLFVRQMEGGQGNVAILRAILTLARNLDLTVVAEGVESDTQHAALKNLACGFGQGFLYSRPVPADQVNRLLAHGAMDRPDAVDDEAPSR